MVLYLNNKDKTIKGLESNFQNQIFIAQNDVMPIFIDRFVYGKNVLLQLKRV
jgi:hypothetical protein